MTLPPLWAITGALGLLAGAWGMHTWQKAQRVDAIEEARKDERGFQRSANQADVSHLDHLRAQKDAAERNAANFKGALDEKNRELADCRVDAAVLGLLDQAGMPDTAGRATEPEPAAARAEAPHRDSTAAVELERCRANYADVCTPNAIQLRDLQTFTRKLILDYNRAIGRE